MSENQEVVTKNAERSENVCGMESVNRVSKLPVVESTVQTATDVYTKIKDYNSLTNWTLSTAESTANKAIEVGKPLTTGVISKLEGPIKKVDQIFCTGLDYVETNVPGVKLPPGEIYSNTKDFVGSAYSKVQPAEQTAMTSAEPALQTAKTLAEPALDKANELKDYGTQKVNEMLKPKDFVGSAYSKVQAAEQTAMTSAEPALEKAKTLAEPALDKANELKDYGTQKVNETLNRNQENAATK